VTGLFNSATVTSQGSTHCIQALTNFLLCANCTPVHISNIYGLIINMLLNNFIYHALWVLPVANAAGKKTAVPLLVTNKCRDTIWPGLFTSNGTGPESLGFELTTESTRNLSVLSDWNGRIWGRTNCTFDDKGLGSCGTGNCGGKLECSITVSF
jgi:hypothetical protein